MTKYASDTAVSVEKSRLEIEAILRRYKADAFGYMSDQRGAVIMFRIKGRHIRFQLPLPDPKAHEFTHSSRGPRAPDVAEKAWEQACRQRWRALALLIKAKLEAVSANISTIEEEFLVHTILPDGQTVGDWIKPQVEHAYLSGAMPTQLMITGPT